MTLGAAFLSVVALLALSRHTSGRGGGDIKIWRARKHLAAASSTAHVKLFGDTCGHFWRSSYTRHHQSILAGLEPAKYAVSLGADVGLADRLVGTFSVFYFALLSGRAFQIATYPGVVDLREALEPAFINWSRAEVDERVIQNIK